MKNTAEFSFTGSATELSYQARNTGRPVCGQSRFLRRILPALCLMLLLAFFLKVPVVRAAEPGASLAGLKLSILGDSISTFTGTQPADYNIFYPESGDIRTREQTWWGQVLRDTGMQLCANASSANTNMTGNSLAMDGSAPGCSIRRIVDLRAADGTAPDIIIVYMGINDFSRSRTPGSFRQPGPRAEGEISDFAEAYELMLLKIKILYPNAAVYCCTLTPRTCFVEGNTGNAVNLLGVDITAYNAQITAVAQAYGAKIIDLYSFSGITPENLSLFLYDSVHPNVHGARLIANCVTATLLSSY